jgi:hypothetical protein
MGYTCIVVGKKVAFTPPPAPSLNSGQQQNSLNPFRIRTSEKLTRNSFRIRTCKSKELKVLYNPHLQKTREEGAEQLTNIPQTGAQQ